jgi:hypothetical protein
MRKFNVKHLGAGAAVAAVAVAAIAIPAWADSGGNGGGERGEVERAPLPFPPPHAAREKLEDAANCLREKGVDLPEVHANGTGASIQAPPPEARDVMRRVAKECDLPPPPPPGRFLPSAKERGEAMDGLSECIREQGGDLPVPPGPPDR